MQIKLNFGALAPFISTQLEALGITRYGKEKIQHFEKLRTAMMELFFNSYVTDAQLSVMHNKLMKKILEHLKEQANG